MTTSAKRSAARTAALAAFVIAAAMTAPFYSDAAGQPAAVAPRGTQAPVALDERHAILAFEQRVTTYVALHRRLEGPLPPVEVSEDMRVVRAAMDALARQIRAARKKARQGDLFAPDVARTLRHKIASCLTPPDLELIVSDQKDHGGFPSPRLYVNAAWPEQVPFIFVPPTLLASLPPLPPELEYRIIRRSLVLWDHHADLIVDVLPAAFPGR